MQAAQFMREDALTARVIDKTGLTFDQLWEHIHIHLYAIPDEPGAARDVLLADPTPWRLRLIRDGALSSQAVLDPSQRSLLTAWALLRWLVEEDPQGVLATKARAEVDREIHSQLTIAGALQAATNRINAKRPRKKKDRPTHIDAIKDLMRPYRDDGKSWDEFLAIASRRGLDRGVMSRAGVDGLDLTHDFETRRCVIRAVDFAEVALDRSEDAVRRWYSECESRPTLRN